MKDSLGSYYFPNASDHTLRCYVRKNTNNEIEFRLWKENEPSVWDKHEWIPLDVIKYANDFYHKNRNKDADFTALYDSNIARMLLDDAEKTQKQ